jgi:hypothetical protein
VRADLFVASNRSWGFWGFWSFWSFWSFLAEPLGGTKIFSGFSARDFRENLGIQKTRYPYPPISASRA